MKLIKEYIKSKITGLQFIKNIVDERDRLRTQLASGGQREENPVAKENRYARDWNEYSEIWQREHGSKYENLGDEWNDDGTEDRKRDELYFTMFAGRFLSSDITVLEVGPGGGKWTVRIAPKVKKVIVLDVSEEMLQRTRKRCESLGISNVEYVLANGRDFQPIPDESINLFFSYDVFVHIALEDTWPYAQEMARVLVSGGKGACHHAINSVPQAWNRIEVHNEHFRFGTHTLGQFYYYSQEALRYMYQYCGLILKEQHQEDWHCTCIFEKPSDSVVPRFEQLLRLLISHGADKEQFRVQIIEDLLSLPALMQQELDDVLQSVRTEDDYCKRIFYAERIRRLWRGI